MKTHHFKSIIQILAVFILYWGCGKEPTSSPKINDEIPSKDLSQYQSFCTISIGTWPDCAGASNENFKGITGIPDQTRSGDSLFLNFSDSLISIQQISEFKLKYDWNLQLFWEDHIPLIKSQFNYDTLILKSDEFQLAHNPMCLSGPNALKKKINLYLELKLNQVIRKYWLTGLSCHQIHEMKIVPNEATLNAGFDINHPEFSKGFDSLSIFGLGGPYHHITQNAFIQRMSFMHHPPSPLFVFFHRELNLSDTVLYVYHLANIGTPQNIKLQLQADAIPFLKLSKE